MKSRATTYVLIAAVAVIWGIILWKIFSPERDNPSAASAAKKTEYVEAGKDTLVLNYRDPFLGPLPKVEKAPVRITATGPAVRKEPEEVQHNLRYLGMIAKDKVNYGLIEINAVLYTLKVGETADGYKIEKVSDSAATLRRKGAVVNVPTCN